MADRTGGAYPKWTPARLIDWINLIKEGPSLEKPQKKRFREEDISLNERLARDDRMRPVWKWHSSVASDVPSPKELTSARDLTSVGLCIIIRQAMRMPGKPGNLPTKKREEYFSKVRRHVGALIELLEGTKFDNEWDMGENFPLDDLDIFEDRLRDHFHKRVDNDIWALWHSIREQDEPWRTVVAYAISKDGIAKLPWDYPTPHFVGFFRDVLNWTYLDDLWGRGFQSSQPIRQSGERAKVIYFNCILYEMLLRNHGIRIPFPILATLANVAFDLQDGEEINELTAQKQVKRYLDRLDDANAVQTLLRTSTVEPDF